MNNPYQQGAFARPAATLAVDARARFIMRTYTHLIGAIFAFAALEVAIFQSGLALPIAQALSGNWMLVFGAMMLTGWGATHFAQSAKSVVAQYFGLGMYVLMQVIIFVPLLYIANASAPGAIESAAMVTTLGFAGLTAVAFVTRKDFSFLKGIMFWGFIMAMVAIVASMIFGFHLGTFFSVAMVGLAGAAILYDTSNVLRHYPENAHVAAALALFASVAMMFYYVLRIFISSRD
ncbi:MAG: Bax inhibitor-1 family protein [Polyangiaceae bacterium]|nr:Bax inhibitor-1 family protein [Polyangiaceae bacterium]